MNDPGNDMVTAAEIASWAWCPESWRLEKGLRLRPANVARLGAGERHHERKVAIERGAQATAKGGLTLVAVGLVALLAVLIHHLMVP